MTTPVTETTTIDDPRRLRQILDRALELGSRHGVSSVLVGVAGFEGDPVFPEVVRYIESGLRVDDSVFRMTRERVVLLLTDVDATRAETIIGRLLTEFSEHFPSIADPSVAVQCFEVGPGTIELTIKQVLPRLFVGPPASH